ncbi:DNA-binding barrel domain superfamily [Sesbania bispinosa]|nr:DNA-binding barrel domain superfamily [Sesbania bispinosa]
MVHVPFPFEFYHSKKDVLGTKVELFDDFDHQFSIGLKFGSRSVVLWKGVEHLKRFYGLDKKLSLFLKYEGGIRFKIEIKDEEINKIPNPVTPALVHLNQRPGANTHGIVIVTAPHSPNNPIPRKFVQEFIRKYWTELILQVGGGHFYSRKLLWRPGSKKDCHLGKPWYKLVSDMKLGRGDKVIFKTIIKGLNRVNVDIIRKGD